MTALLLSLAFAAIAGAPFATRLDPRPSGARWIGESLLTGLALAAAILLLFSLTGLPWALGACTFVMAAAALLAFRRVRPSFGRPHPIDALTAIVLIAYARFATAAAPWELDFIDDWGLKARVFANAGGIDWSFLQNPGYWWSHPDYPLLLPLTYDFTALFTGGWDDRWLGGITVAFAIAALLIVRSLAEEDLGSRMAGASAGLVMAWLFCTPWIGIADGPFVACAVAALLLIRRKDFTAGAFILGLAASCKNEGLTLVAAVLLAMALLPEWRSGLRKMWPAVAIPLPWLVLRSVHHLQTDLTSEGMFSRALTHLSEPETYVRMLTAYAGGRPLLWTGILLAAVLSWKTLIRHERLLLIVAFLQTLFYLGAYVVTPLDVGFHIRWSWDRLVWHLTAIIVAAVLFGVLRERGVDDASDRAAETVQAA